MQKKNIIFLSISLVLIMLLGIGVSYSMWNVSVSQDTNNTAYTECFDLSISNKENNINLDNAYPISNDKGKSLTPYTFTVTNTCDITTQYNINLEVLNNSTLSSKFIDVMFEGNINLLSSYASNDKVNTSSIESRKLTTGILKSQESKDYSLRLWIDYNTTLEDLNNEIKTFKSKIVVVGKPINYNGDTVFNFDYTGSEQVFTVPQTGTYKIETWGASGGQHSNSVKQAHGGYSGGQIFLNSVTKLYIYVGSTDLRICDETAQGRCLGGYNGGGDSWFGNSQKWGSGGGATHAAMIPGILSTLENSKENILIVAGGGGGTYNVNGASGGGYVGVNGHFRENFTTANGGTQISGGSGYTSGTFGQGGICKEGGINCSGGGGGYYGGASAGGIDGAGGSGYIGNSLLINKVMYCYNCEESNEESTKTISTTCSEETPTSYCAKKGNGYARITLVSIDE